MHCRVDHRAVFPPLPAGDTVSTLMGGSNLAIIAPQILRCSKEE